MIGRKMDFKIKLLKDLNFEYTGDRYTHPCGFEIWCSDMAKASDEDFQEYTIKINNKIQLLEEYKRKTFEECQRLLDEITIF